MARYPRILKAMLFVGIVSLFFAIYYHEAYLPKWTTNEQPPSTTLQQKPTSTATPQRPSPTMSQRMPSSSTSQRKTSSTTTAQKVASTMTRQKSTSTTTPPKTRVNPASTKEPVVRFSPKRYVTDVAGFKRYLAYLGKVEPSLPRQDKAVIVVTNFRSGSSFFGELLQKHPDVFYIYEPLWPLSELADCTINADLKLKVLKDLVQCNLSDWNHIYAGMDKEKKIQTMTMMLKQCLTRGMCFTEKTAGMCEDRHCPRSNSRINSCKDDCGVLNMQLVNNDCRRKKAVAMKVIRLCNILDMKEIVQALPTNIKILHLVRDPRGIANSARNINYPNLTKLMTVTCKRQAQNMASGIVDPPDWLKGKYKMFRYEDVALHPYNAARSVYDFVELSFPESMKHWIAKNTLIPIPRELSMNPVETSPNSTNGLKTASKPQRIILSKSKKNYLHYTTQRDSRATVQNWVYQLPYDTAKFVESVCTDIMKNAGYRLVGTHEEYKENGGVPYFTTDENETTTNLQ